MVDPVGIFSMLGIPLTIGGAIALLIQVVIISLVIVALDYVIQHEINIKSAFIIAFASYFLTIIAVLALGLANYVDPLVAGYVLPLVVWVALGEVLIKEGDAKKKAIVAGAAFVVYTVLNALGVIVIISSFIPF